ncbi:MAG: M14 family zinc carboxypeptidase [Promethearchaeota archaeon]
MRSKSQILFLTIFLLIFFPASIQGQTRLLNSVFVVETYNSSTNTRTWAPISLIYPDQYHNPNELLEELQLIANTAPEIVDLFTIGQSIQERDIHCLRITNEQNTDTKAGVLFVAHHHAREQITVEAVLRFILHLVNGFGIDQTLTDFIDSEEIFIIPTLNPDGLHYVVEEEKFWLRKNLHLIDDDNDGLFNEDPADDVDGDGVVSGFDVYTKNGNKLVYDYSYLEGTDDDGDGLVNEDDIGGIDLNRNYAYRWNDSSLDTGWGSDTTSETYPGTAPFSEPETKAFHTFVNKKLFATAMALHSGINATYFPWASEGATWSEPSLYYLIYNDFLEMWPNLENYLRRKLTTIETQKYFLPTYTSAGSWDDWMYAEKQCLVPMIYEIYHNGSEECQEQLIISNSSHQIMRLDHIFQYFTPFSSAIDSLWDEIQLTFDYWLQITPRLKVEVNSVSGGKVEGEILKMELSIENLSPRVRTVEDLNVLNYDFDPLLKDGNAVTSPEITAAQIVDRTIEFNLEQTIVPNATYSIRIGNNYIGYKTLNIKEVSFTTKEKSIITSESTSWGLIGIVLAIMTVCLWIKGRKEPK